MIGLIGVVLSLGLVACIVSHYRMGARSWSERRSRPAPHDPQPYQHVLLPQVQSVSSCMATQLHDNSSSTHQPSPISEMTTYSELTS